METESRLVFLWITDAWEKLDRKFDTSLRLLRESLSRGHLNYFCTCDEVIWDLRDAQLSCRRVEMSGSPLMTRGHSELKRPAEFDFIMLRADPPLSVAYSGAIQMLSRSLEAKGIDTESRLVNSPNVLLTRNSRLLALSSPDAPETFVSNDIHAICQFVERRDLAVFKSLQGSMGRGVLLVRRTIGMQKVRALIRKLTADGEVPIIAQEYLAPYFQSEKRIWYVDGKILGVGKKRFAGRKFPPHLAKQETLVSTDLTNTERAVCERLGRILLKLNIRLAGVDVIDSHVTDVNVASPGLLVEMEHAEGTNLASLIINAIERGNQNS
jgi:glutathione synthase